MNYLKKILKVIIWPFLFGIGQFLIQYIFVYIFNIGEINKLKKLNPGLSNGKIMSLLNKLIKTTDYNNRLTNYINNNTLLIIVIILVIFLPILYLGFKKYKKNNKLKLNNVTMIILLGMSISLIYNISMYNLNNIFHFTNQFKISKLSIIVQIISSGIIGPILEEILFRGIVYNKLKEFNPPMKSIIIATLIFSLMHTNFVNMIYAFIISFMLIYVYEKYKTLKAPILLHITSNITIILFIYVLVKNSFINYILLFLSLVILILIYLKNIKKDV